MIEKKEKTTISISSELWERLNKLKTSKTKTFEELILMILNEKEEKKNEHTNNKEMAKKKIGLFRKKVS